MELKLSAEEVEKIILEWAEQKFAGQFNNARFEAQYGSFRYVELSKVEPDAQS